MEDIRNLSLIWECYTPCHGEGLGKSSGGRIRANARKWESCFSPAQ